MNERIKQLAQQAGAHVSTRNLMSNPPQHIETMELWDDRIEKFAELIVQECISACATDRLGKTAGVEELIKQHFGVE